MIHKSLVLKSVCDRDSGGDDGISARKFARYHLAGGIGTEQHRHRVNILTT